MNTAVSSLAPPAPPGVTMSGVRLVGAVPVLPRISSYGEEVRFIDQEPEKKTKKAKNPEFSKRYVSCENLNHPTNGRNSDKQLSYKNTFFNIIENKFRVKKKKKHNSVDHVQLLSHGELQQSQCEREEEGVVSREEEYRRRRGKEVVMARGWRELGQTEERTKNRNSYQVGDRMFLDVQDLRPDDRGQGYRRYSHGEIDRKLNHEEEMEQRRKEINNELRFYNKTGLPVIGTKSELARAIEKYKYDKFKKEDNKRRSQLEEVLYDRNRRKKERIVSSCSPSGSDSSDESGTRMDRRFPI